MTQQTYNIISKFQEAYVKGKEVFQRDTGINPVEKQMSPRRCVIGWGTWEKVLALEDCAFRRSIVEKHKALLAPLEISQDVDYYGIVFVYSERI
jgi:hypothetical protein